MWWQRLGVGVGEKSLCKYPLALVSHGVASLLTELFPRVHLIRSSQYPVMEAEPMALPSLSNHDSSCCLLSTYYVPGTVLGTSDTWYHLILATFWEGK